MEQHIGEMIVNGITYVPKSQNQIAEKVDGMGYVIIRSDRAGVFAGYLSNKMYTKSGTEVTLINSRRLWYWSGAATLSQLAVDGTNNPNSCKFPCEVPKHTISGVLEIIPTTAKAQQSIKEVKIWEQ